MRCELRGSRHGGVAAEGFNSIVRPPRTDQRARLCPTPPDPGPGSPHDAELAPKMVQYMQSHLRSEGFNSIVRPPRTDQRARLCPTPPDPGPGSPHDAELAPKMVQYMHSHIASRYERTPQQELARAELLRRSFPNSQIRPTELPAAQELAAHERRAGLSLNCKSRRPPLQMTRLLGRRRLLDALFAEQQ